MSKEKNEGKEKNHFSTTNKSKELAFPANRTPSFEQVPEGRDSLDRPRGNDRLLHARASFFVPQMARDVTDSKRGSLRVFPMAGLEQVWPPHPCGNYVQCLMICLVFRHVGKVGGH